MGLVGGVNVTILGAGAWGTALALHAARLGHTVTLVPRRLEQALALAAERENRDYLPGFKLPVEIQIGLEIRPVIMEAELVLLACPMRGLRALAGAVQRELDAAWAGPMFVTLCKGMEVESLKLPHAVLAEALPGRPTGVLSGPSYAGEVAAGKPTAVVLATEADDPHARRVQEALSGPALRVYRSRDVAGVELAGALKNVYAIGAGVCDGLRLGDNAKAAYLTRALHEMARLGTRLGGQAATFYGLSGFGDLVVTCEGKWSRNRTLGEELTRGRSAEEVLKGRKTVAEGHAAAAAFAAVCARERIEAPILAEIHAVLYAGKDPRRAIPALMERELKEEGG